jgi:lipoprotein NlpD
MLLVKEQQYIKAGEVIAKMGKTDATEVKLHFEIRYRGKSVNPIKYLPKR